MELTATEILYIGFAAAIIVQTIKLLAAKFKQVQPTVLMCQITATVVSILLAVAFLFPQLRVEGEPMEIVGTIVEASVAVFGMATLIYYILLKKILDGVGLSTEAMLR